MSDDLQESLSPWIGNWKSRLKHKLESLGYASIDAFYERYPSVGYVQLAEMLGDANVCAMQLYNDQVDIAYRTDNLRSVAIDMLVRLLNEYVRKGWNIGQSFEFRRASAFATWSTTLLLNRPKIRGLEKKLDHIFDHLKALPIPDGWLPKNSGDEYISDAFNSRWPI